MQKKKRRINRELQRENIGLLILGIVILVEAYYILYVMGGSI